MNVIIISAIALLILVILSVLVLRTGQAPEDAVAMTVASFEPEPEVICESVSELDEETLLGSFSCDSLRDIIELRLGIPRKCSGWKEVCTNTTTNETFETGAGGGGCSVYHGNDIADFYVENCLKKNE